MTRDCPGAARKGFVRQDAQVVFPTSENSLLVRRRTSPSHFEVDGLACGGLGGGAEVDATSNEVLYLWFYL